MSGLRCKKVRHRTKTDAFIAWKRTGRNVQLNIYQCKHCEGWHLGSSRNPLRKIDRLNQLFAQLNKESAT